ncbi:MAG: protein phosphatase 2C domain-containing protein [Lachnospiraceae bacterium]|nr:protein phosphatase 2C domain-containing protein [Lachnospiraceae bacterium]
MKLKRVKSLLIAFALCCMLAAPALAGCSGGETDAQTEQTAGVTEGTDRTEKAAGAAEEEDQTDQADDAAEEEDQTDQADGDDDNEDTGTADDGDQAETPRKSVTGSEGDDAGTEDTGKSGESGTDTGDEDTGTDDEKSSGSTAAAEDEDTVTDTFKSIADSEDETENEGGILKYILFAVIGFAVGFLLALVIAFLLNRSSRKNSTSSADVIEKKETENPAVQKKKPVEAGSLPDADSGTIGKVHNVGCRRNQQDTVGFTNAGNGLLAVVSDGMGGLSDGEKVSQQAVMGMLQAAERVNQVTADNPLYEMLAAANSQVLKMLGPDKIYKSGATLLAVYTDGAKYHWIAVGDSRIYLYCGHHLLQVNSEHIYKRQLFRKAVNRKISFATVKNDPQRDRLVSFLGMGDLEEIDGSLRPAELQHGDKLLLMSDGVFNAVSEKAMLKILENTKNAAEAAVLMENQVLAAGNPKQDNFTCLILDF